MRSDSRSVLRTHAIPGAVALTVSTLLLGCPSSEQKATPKAATETPASAQPTATVPTSGPPAAAPQAAPTAPKPEPAAATADAGKAAPPTVQGVIQVPTFGDKPGKPKLCEVEFKGKVVYPGKLPEDQRWYFVVAQGSDCLAKSAHIIGGFWANPDSTFFGEVFSKWGADLTLCVAAVTEANGPSTVYAKATEPFHAEKIGEVEFEHLVLTPKSGPKIQFPASRPAL